MEYEDLPAIVGIDEAIKANSFLEVGHPLAWVWQLRAAQYSRTLTP